jgi:TonB family protein
MQFIAAKAARLIAGTVALFSFTCAVSAEDVANAAWPETVVKFEDLHPITSFELKIPGVVSKGRVTGPSVLKAHITREGTVSKVVLLESGGNPDLDESAIRALRVMRFKPVTFGSEPIEVTLALPVHVPAKFGRSR